MNYTRIYNLIITYYIWRHFYFKQIFLITSVNLYIANQIIKLVDQTLHQKQTYSCSADTPAFETQINQLIYKLYDLTEERIKTIEKNVI